MQVFLVGLSNHFEFEMTEDSSNIKRVPLFVMVTMVRGQEEKGVRVPLGVELAPPEEDLEGEDNATLCS